MSLVTRFFPQRFGKMSYSQLGEDLILDQIFNSLDVFKPLYLDIGAYHPVHLSNTFRFYRKGASGVCVEPDPNRYAYFKRLRKRDICLNVGVGSDDQANADYYVFSPPTLNTFSKEEAQRYQAGHTLQKVLKVRLLSVNHIISQYCSKTPDLISIDVEGMELEILRALDLSRFRPTVLCVETLTYTTDKSETKVTEVNKLLLGKGYFIYADTYVNTIFVDQRTWAQR